MIRLAHAKRRDANEREIVEALRKLGASVMYTDQVDLIVGYKGRNYLFEVKDAKKLYLKDGVRFRKGAIKPAQAKLMSTWLGQYHIATSLDAILEIIDYQGDTDATI